MFHGSGENLEHDFIVQSGANPALIGFRLDRPAHLTSSGDLEVDLGESVLRLRKPLAYQDRGTIRKEVTAKFVLTKSGEVRVKVGAYDRHLPLVIDPVFVFSTYLTGSAADQITAVTTDSAGNVYVTGFTGDASFPVTNAANPLCSQCSDASQTNEGFISKLDPTSRSHRRGKVIEVLE